MGFMLTTTVDSENPVVHDLRLVNGQLRFLIPSLERPSEYAEEIGQRIKTRLLLIRGEWFLDQRKGVPYSTRVIGKAGVTLGLDQVREMFYSVVAGTPGVEAVDSITLDLNRETRELTVQIEARGAVDEPIRVADLQIPFAVGP